MGSVGDDGDDGDGVHHGVRRRRWRGRRGIVVGVWAEALAARGLRCVALSAVLCAVRAALLCVAVRCALLC